MRRDWIWAWVGAVAAIVVAAIGIKSTGIFVNSPGMAVGLVLVLTMIVSTVILWLKNQHSIRMIRRSGGDAELIIRPVDALAKIVFLFPLLFGLQVLVRLMITGSAAIKWDEVILFSATMAYVLGLTTTAYKKPKYRRPK